ncbi:hypothetical protein [Brevibacterium sp. FME17]|uniref:hypothetical protein n=1 Tax=Brevibacterium sp. FME17 TaxID=2742606 RepID=UPI00186811AC|nr:hypothetical protein [Brevibacterium sp. FME17]
MDPFTLALDPSPVLDAAGAVTQQVVASIDNPFDGDVRPDFDAFGGAFTEWWQKLFGGLWALAIVVAAASLIWALVALKKARETNMPGQADDAKTSALWAGGALIGLVGFGVIMGAIIFVAG